MTGPSSKLEQRERREVLINDARANAERLDLLLRHLAVRKPREPKNTFHNRAQGEANEVSGRFAQTHKSNVTGSAPSVEYPALPTGPWSGPDPTGVEPPIDATDCGNTFGFALGEPHEQPQAAEVLPYSATAQGGGDPAAMASPPTSTLKKRKLRGA